MNVHVGRITTERAAVTMHPVILDVNTARHPEWADVDKGRAVTVTLADRA